MLSFLDALASPEFMLECGSVGNVFEILSNIGHVIRVCTEYVQSMFRVCSEFVQIAFRVCSECVQGASRVRSEFVSFHHIAHLVCHFLKMRSGV